MIVTTTKHAIKVQADDIKNRFYSGRMDALLDELQIGDVEDFERGIKNLHADIVTVDEEGYSSLFRDGYTMVLLGEKDFEFIETWFKRDMPAAGPEELVVSIMRGKEVIEEVHYSDLSY